MLPISLARPPYRAGTIVTDICAETNKNSTCILTPDHEGRHFDANSGHSWVQTVTMTVEPETPVVNRDAVHRSHCCSVHGCKYAMDQQQENECPVSNGTIQQDHPCEHCDFHAEGLKQATDAQIATELTRRGYHDAAACL